MKLFGWTLARTRDLQKALAPVDNRGGWWPIIRESVAGAWQFRTKTIRISNGGKSANSPVLEIQVG